MCRIVYASPTGAGRNLPGYTLANAINYAWSESGVLHTRVYVYQGRSLVAVYANGRLVKE